MSSFRNTDWIVNKLIEDQGQDIIIYNNSISVDGNGNVISETFSNTIETKAWVMVFGGLLESYDLLGGYHTEGDYSVCVSNTVAVNPNDIIILKDGTRLEVREIISHYEFNDVQYRELISRREGERET